MGRLAAGVRRRKDGTLEKRFTIDGKRYSVYSKNFRDLLIKETHLREKLIAEGKALNNTRREYTLDQYFEEWIERKKMVVKPSTIYTYRHAYMLNISPLLGGRKLQDLKRIELYHMQQNLCEKYNPTNVNQLFKIVRMILNDAECDEMIDSNPARSIKPVMTTRTPAVKTIHRALTEKEQILFMNAAKGNYYYDFMAFLLLTGMRYGEAAVLTWDEIDFDKKVIHVIKNRTLSEDGSVTIGTPKTKASSRDIPMSRTLVSILKRQIKKKEMQPEDLDDLGDERIFSTNRNEIISDNTINRAIESVIESMDDPIERFTVHAFRDTFATRFIEQGGKPQTLKSILGHSSISITMDLYSQVLPNTKQKEIDMVKIVV